MFIVGVIVGILVALFIIVVIAAIGTDHLPAGPARTDQPGETSPEDVPHTQGEK